MKYEALRKLKVSHAAIAAFLDEIQMNSRKYKEARPLVRNFHEQMLSHFMLMNERFFEVLQESYYDNREALKMIEFLVVDLKQLKVTMLGFFDKYSGEPGTPPHAGMFPIDFAKFSQDILARIDVEEKYLVPLIEGSSL